MYYDELSTTMDHLLQDGKGILAADESNGTIGKRFAAINLENTADNRQDYRLLLATTPHLGDYINGVILFEETFQNKDTNGTSIVDLF
ncbi:MAG TPA: fructose-bisphosphate aldolase class I, partial [Legionella sp.]|nr:fructose-bisphosphate aldolase class I [Legionella sp.]